MMLILIVAVDPGEEGRELLSTRGKAEMLPDKTAASTRLQV